MPPPSGFYVRYSYPSIAKTLDGWWKVWTIKRPDEPENNICGRDLRPLFGGTLLRTDRTYFVPTGRPRVVTGRKEAKGNA